MHQLRHIIAELAEKLPAEMYEDPEIAAMAAYGCTTRKHVVRLLAPPLSDDDHSKDIDFSAHGILARWNAGYADTQRALAKRARDHRLGRGDSRAAARAQAIAGRALRNWGRHGEAREQLTAAVEVLRADPDPDTVRALHELAALEVFAGSPDADRLSAEALTLGEALDIGAGQLAQLFTTRGLYLASIERRAQAIAHLRESARLATQAGDNLTLGRALSNLSYALTATDPAAAADAARTAVGHQRRVGNQIFLAYAIGNLAGALLQLGDWDAAEAEFTQAVDSGGLADIEYLACERGRLAALRGDTMTAETLLAGLQDLRSSEDPQDKAFISLVEAFTAAARRQPQDALRHARAVLAHADALGIGSDLPRWAWPLAARAAFELQDIAATHDLLTLLDSYQPGYLVPMLRAERDLARARLADHDGDQSAAAAFTSAISSLRELSTPYHLAGGLLDHAEYLTRHGDAAAAAEATGEARDIARRLRCQPLLDRAADIAPAESRMRT
ncbi:MAG: DUF3734 domain-containing protein [Rhodomicrobium sp.]